MPMLTERERLLRLARRRGGLNTRDVAGAGIHRQVLSRLVREGALERVARAQYRLPDALVTEHHGLAVAAAAVPNGIVCLLSALAFHGVGTQMPFQVWMAIDGRARRPALTNPPLRVVRFTGQALTAGIETHRVERQAVRIYCVAKTVADCFKYRHKIGLEAGVPHLRRHVLGISGFWASEIHRAMRRAGDAGASAGPWRCDRGVAEIRGDDDTGAGAQDAAGDAGRSV